MARGATRLLSPWDAAVQETVAKGTRYRLRLVQASPFIYVRDLKPTPGQAKEWSLKPRRRDTKEDVEWVLFRILGADHGPWELPRGNGVVTVPLDWSQISLICLEDWKQRMKASSSTHYRAELKNLSTQEVELSSNGCRSWALQKPAGKRPFLTRVDTLSQIRRSLVLKDPEAIGPSWLQEDLLKELRQMHTARLPTRSNDLQAIRGIPTRQEAETYLDGIAENFPLEQWCLAMQLCYGLRNHELWWISSITRGEGDELPGWILVPGWWRTKSKEEHWIWPLFPEWIERYGLAARLEAAQEALHRHKTPAVVSANDQSKPWIQGNPADPGLCMNNQYLGEWITKRMRGTLPPWLARVPDTAGRYRSSDQPQRITPYDLRHAWAVTVATDPSFRKVTDEQAARAMGHDVEVHRRRYQRWIGSEGRKRRAMDAFRPG